MKKKLIVVGVLLAVLLTGCGQGDGENSVLSSVPCSEPDSEQNVENSHEPNDRNVHPYYTMSDGESDIAALLFLGGGDEAEAGKTLLQEKYFSALDGRWPETVETAETESWQESYLLVPKYPGTVITVQKLDTDEQLVGELISTEHPVLLRCNHSDVVRSMQVTVTYQDESITFKPSISGQDGGCVAAEGIYTEVMG